MVRLASIALVASAMAFAQCVSVDAGGVSVNTNIANGVTKTQVNGVDIPTPVNGSISTTATYVDGVVKTQVNGVDVPMGAATTVTTTTGGNGTAETVSMNVGTPEMPVVISGPSDMQVTVDCTPVAMATGKRPRRKEAPMVAALNPPPPAASTDSAPSPQTPEVQERTAPSPPPVDPPTILAPGTPLAATPLNP